MHDKRQKKAFTLIELLVVIAIIALLLSIMMPALRKAKQTAQKIICRSNLRQWGMIWKVYTDENDGKLPDCTGFGALRGDWIIALRKDYPTDKMTQCPSATKFVDFGPPANNRGGVFSTYRNDYADGSQDFCSYGMNIWAYSTTHFIMNPNPKTKNWGSFEVGSVSTSTIPFFMDSIYRGSAPQYNGYDPMTMANSPEPLPDNGFEHVYDGIRQFTMPRHGSSSKVGINVLFMDLSVRHVMIKEMWSLKWHKQFDTGKWKTERARIWPAPWMDNLSEDF